MLFRNQIEGRSGCKIEFIKGHMPLIRKYSKNIDYNLRLLYQIQKQEKCYQVNQSDRIFTPSVLSHNYTVDGLCFFDMEYINGLKFSTFLNDLCIDELAKHINYILEFVEHNRRMLTSKLLDKKLFIDKLSSINDVLVKNGVAYKSIVHETIDSLYRFNYDIPFPVSDCHGDLTFSNMLFKNDSIYIFDFLDSFIDSYLIDIVKLRQDTSFMWSILIDSNLDVFNSLKLKQIMNYFDRIIDEKYKNDIFYNSWYSCLQKYNLLRILPYVENLNEIHLIEDGLINLKSKYA